MKEKTITPSKENYLCMLLDLSEDKPETHSIDVACAFGYSRASVSRMVKVLGEEGYILKDDEGRISFTERGRETAESIRRKRNLLIHYFSEVLGVDTATAEKDACKIEHLISSETELKLAEHYSKEDHMCSCEFCGESYSSIFMDHFRNPRNTGFLVDADGEGKAGDPECGDHLVITIKVRNRKIEDVRFLVYGCSAAIATSSVTMELAMGKTLKEAEAITDHDIMKALGGLPEHKLHCSLLGPTALRGAIRDYYDRVETFKKSLACD